MVVLRCHQQIGRCQHFALFSYLSSIVCRLWVHCYIVSVAWYICLQTTGCIEVLWWFICWQINSSHQHNQTDMPESTIHTKSFSYIFYWVYIECEIYSNHYLECILCGCFATSWHVSHLMIAAIVQSIFFTDLYKWNMCCRKKTLLNN